MINRKKDIILKSVGILLWVLFLIVPGTTLARFDGLPLSQSEIVVAAFVLLVLVGTPWEKITFIRQGILTTLVLLGVVHIIGFFMLPGGWSICLQREIAQETLKTPCEASVEFRGGERSFLLQSLDLRGKKFPLYFMNDATAFNFFRPEEPNRLALPYTFQASAFFRPSSDTTIDIYTTIPNVSLSLDGEAIGISPQAVHKLVITGQTIHDISVSFTKSRDEQDVLTVTTPAFPFYEKVGASNSAIVWVFRVVWFALFGAIFSFLLYSLVRFLSTLPHREMTKMFLLLLFSIFTGAILKSPYALLTIIIAVICLFTLPLKNDRPKSWIITFSLFILFLNSVFFVSRLVPYGDVVLFSGGGDELTHESSARSTFTASTFRNYLIAEENRPFYYQPFARYIVGALHVFFGESMWGVYVIQTWLMSIAIFLATYALFLWNGWKSAGIFLFFFMLLERLPSYSIFSLTLTPLQQAVGFPILFLAIGLTLILFLRVRGLMTHLTVGILWGLAISIRTDVVALVTFLMLYLFFLLIRKEEPIRMRLKKIGFVLGGLAFFPILVVLRNEVVSNQFAFIAKSGVPNVLPAFYPIFDYPYDPIYNTPGILPSVNGSKIVFRILEEYQNNLSSLWNILKENLTTAYIGTGSLRKYLWYSPIPFVTLGIFFAPLKRKLIFFGLSLSLGEFILISSFFLPHNGVAVFAHIDLLLLILASLGLGNFLSGLQYFPHLTKIIDLFKQKIYLLIH